MEDEAHTDFEDDPEYHTYLQEKYIQEAAALAQYRPKFLKRSMMPFPQGRGPSDVNNAKNFNQKLTSYIEDSLYECEDAPE